MIDLRHGLIHMGKQSIVIYHVPTVMGVGKCILIIQYVGNVMELVEKQLKKKMLVINADIFRKTVKYGHFVKFNSHYYVVEQFDPIRNQYWLRSCDEQDNSNKCKNKDKTETFSEEIG